MPSAKQTHRRVCLWDTPLKEQKTEEQKKKRKFTHFLTNLKISAGSHACNINNSRDPAHGIISSYLIEGGSEFVIPLSNFLK